VFSRDYIVRQVQILVQVLERVLLHKRSNQLTEASDVINNTFLEIYNLDSAGFLHLTESELLSLCSSGGPLNPEEALALADLLVEEGYARSDLGDDAAAERYFGHALALYKAALNSEGAVVPFDIHDRIKNLS